MADFSSYTHKFRASGDVHQQNGANKVSKRNRQPLSCAPCRFKKLKCDRGHPCETCIKRGDEESCTYGKLTALPKPDSGTRGKAQERLRHLEQLVMQIVDPKGTSPLSSDKSRFEPDSSHGSSSSPSLTREGHLQYGSIGSSYVGSTHWSAVLENIQELKTALGTDPGPGGDVDELEDVESHESETLFGSPRSLSLHQILAQYLPPRLQVDRRLSTYFNSKYLNLPLIHGGQFRRQYEQFWTDPLALSPLWVSILFSICCMSATLNEAVGSEPSTPEDENTPSARFLRAAAQCLALGGYTRPKKYVVEALALYAHCKYMATLDPSGEVGIIFSILVRLAYRAGYHRDPDHFPYISTFEGEMRRRTWAACKQFDLMVSFQLGLPNCIHPDSWDTRSPRNLLDTDFDEDTTSLPPSRPESEPTKILYFIVKSRLMAAFGKICQHALSFRESTQAEIMALDAEVRATFSTVPEPLRIRPMSQSFADPPYLIMVRTNCEVLYQKSICVLHRKYMTEGNEYSTRACVDAAIAITRHMVDLHKEFKPGGQLHADRWMLSSFTLNDFLLAAMVLCLALSMWKKRHPGRDIKDDPAASGQLEMLKQSYDICLERAQTSTESKRVAEALSVILNKLEAAGDARDNHGHYHDTDPPESTSSAPLQGSSSYMYPSPLFDVNLTPLSLDDSNATSQFQAQSQFQTLSLTDPLGPTEFTVDFDFEPFSSILFTNQNNPIDWPFLDTWMANPNSFYEDMITQQPPQPSLLSLQPSLPPPPQQSWTPMRFFGGSGADLPRILTTSEQYQNADADGEDGGASARHGNGVGINNGIGDGQLASY